MSTLALSDDQKARLRAEIDARYRKKKPRKRTSFVGLRLREFHKLANRWYGTELPDDEDGRDFLRVVANHLAHQPGDPYARILDWIDLWAPWMESDEAEDIALRISENPLTYSADVAADRIWLDRETRDRLGIRTIGAHDFDKEDRAELRRLKHAAREACRRARQGATPRSACLARTRPWEALGISERTYYRRQQQRRASL
jgi:hypothetical protein